MKEAKIEVVAHDAELVGFPTSALCSTITASAKVCTAQDQDVNPDELDKHKEFVRKLMQWGHYSPMEFVDLTFYLTTSRAVANELVRHRMASYMQESQRFVKYDNGLQVIMPATVKDTLEDALWREQVSDAYDTYLFLLEKGHKPEDARTVLPMATATRMLCKMNLREFRHFICLRTAPAAWSEMRILANLMAEAFAKQFPDEVFLISDVWHKDE